MGLNLGFASQLQSSAHCQIKLVLKMGFAIPVQCLLKDGGGMIWVQLFSLETQFLRLFGHCGVTFFCTLIFWYTTFMEM